VFVGVDERTRTQTARTRLLDTCRVVVNISAMKSMRSIRNLVKDEKPDLVAE
jgi:hypothetical protein